jgi:hypothetical protein
VHDVLVGAGVEVGAPAGEVDLGAVHHHPPLVRLLGGEVRVGYVGLPHLVPAPRPPDWHLRIASA